MKKNILKLLVFLTSRSIFACDIQWEKLPFKTPYYEVKASPQGLTYFKEYIVLANHYKNSSKLKSSDLIFLNKETFEIKRKVSFPDGYFHIGGLTSDDKYIYAVDFDKPGLIRVDVNKSFKKNMLDSERIFEVQTNGSSGLGLYKNILAISDYWVPFRSPYFTERFIHFYDLLTGKRIYFKGDLLSSNYSQGLTFFEQNGRLFLAESINDFRSVAKYHLTGLDNKPDIIRIYTLDLKAKEIKHINDLSIPSTMVEDLAFDGKYFYTTDEQDFHFYKGTITSTCSL